MASVIASVMPNTYPAAMHSAKTRGYFGIGAEGVSKSANMGALLRTAHAFGAAFCFTIGGGWDARAGRTADTADSQKSLRLRRYQRIGHSFSDPGATLVAKPSW